MKSFKTLRGALAGDEPDEPTYFAYSATLRISGGDLDLEKITRKIGAKPTSSRRKGERKAPTSPPFREDSWLFQPDIPEAHPLEDHIDALWRQIGPARDYLIALKQSAKIDVFLGYRSNTDHAGIEVPYTSLEMFTSLEIPFGISIIIT